MKKRKDGRYVDTIIINGKRKFVYGRTKPEVKQKMKDLEFLATRSGTTFRMVAEEYERNQFPQLSYNTLKGYRPALARATEYFGETLIDLIKPKDVNGFLMRFIRNMQPARKTAATQLMIMNLVFKYAVAVGYIEANPARDISLPRNLEHTAREIPSDDDIRTIEKHCDDTKFGLMALWILYTGLRRGELLALRWDDVNVFRRTVTISKSVYHIGNAPHLKEPKTEAGIRTVGLPDALMKHLVPGTGLIFKGKDGLMTESEMTYGWNKWCRQLGISVTPHQLRHAYATMLYDAGIDIKDSQRLLGHAQASTTQDIYTHIRKEREDMVNEKVINLKFGS